MCCAFFFWVVPGLFGPFVSLGRCWAVGLVMQWAAWVGRGYCCLQEPSKTGQIMQEAGKKMSIYKYLHVFVWKQLDFQQEGAQDHVPGGCFAAPCSAFPL